MIEVLSDIFHKELKKMCEQNWKAKAILNRADNNFNKMSVYHKELFCNHMHFIYKQGKIYYKTYTLNSFL